MHYTQITVVFKMENKPPYFIGSQIRGGLGYALKKVCCINPSYTCEGCFAQNNCLYYDFYEKKNQFHQYRLDFELDKEFYDFSIYLFEQACEKLPYVLSALQLLLTQNGIGKNREKPKTFSLFINGEESYNDQKIVIPKDPIKTFKIDGYSKNVKLHLLTPLRIKQQNRFIDKNHLTLFDIINSTYQRQMRLLLKGYKKYPYKVAGEVINKELRFQELTRYSNRQKTAMHLGGIVGTMEICNLSKEDYNVLKLAELIGVGKQTVFGLGKVRVGQIG